MYANCFSTENGTLHFKSLEGAQPVPLHLLELLSPLLKGPLGRMVLFEEVAMVAAQVTPIGDIDRAKAVFGDAEEEETEPGKIVEGEGQFWRPRNTCGLPIIHEVSPWLD